VISCGFLLDNVTVPVQLDLIHPDMSIRFGISMGINEGWVWHPRSAFFARPIYLDPKTAEGVRSHI